MNYHNLYLDAYGRYDVIGVHRREETDTNISCRIQPKATVYSSWENLIFMITLIFFFCEYRNMHVISENVVLLSAEYTICILNVEPDHQSYSLQGNGA